MPPPPPPVASTASLTVVLDPVLEAQHVALINVLSGLNIGPIVTKPSWATPVPAAQRAYADFALDVLHRVRQSLPPAAPTGSNEQWGWAKGTRPARP